MCASAASGSAASGPSRPAAPLEDDNGIPYDDDFPYRAAEDDDSDDDDYHILPVAQ